MINLQLFTNHKSAPIKVLGINNKELLATCIILCLQIFLKFFLDKQSITNTTSIFNAPLFANCIIFIINTIMLLKVPNLIILCGCALLYGFTIMYTEKLLSHYMNNNVKNKIIHKCILIVINMLLFIIVTKIMLLADKIFQIVFAIIVCVIIILILKAYKYKLSQQTYWNYITTDLQNFYQNLKK